MFLPTPGINRDRTAEFTSFRTSGGDRTDHESSRLLDRGSSGGSALERYFEVYRDVRLSLKRASLSYAELLRAQQRCLRPTFADANDDLSQLSKSVASITADLAEMRRMISLLDVSFPSHPDRTAVLRNLHSALRDSYRHFSADFRMSQEAFAASYARRPPPDPDDAAFDIASVIPGAEQRQVFAETELQLGQLVQRAADVREIFAELAEIVSMQGTIIDRIDCNIRAGLENAVTAGDEVERAAQYQGRTRLWICALLLVVVIVALFVAAWLK